MEWTRRLSLLASWLPLLAVMGTLFAGIQDEGRSSAAWLAVDGEVDSPVDFGELSEEEWEAVALPTPGARTALRGHAAPDLSAIGFRAERARWRSPRAPPAARV